MPTSILAAYATRYGSTGEVAQVVAEKLCKNELEAETSDNCSIVSLYITIGWTSMKEE